VVGYSEVVSLRKTGSEGDRLAHGSLTGNCIRLALRKYTSSELGLGNLAPHDLRRTYARLAHQGRAKLEQIQISLGHASVQTTERYLGVKQNLADAPCDHLGMKLYSVPPKSKLAA
jgi:integrase